MSSKIDFDAFPPGWVRSDYVKMESPTASGKVVYTLAPAIPIRVWNPAVALPDDSDMVLSMTVIDTGATMPSVPMWGVQEMGIALSEDDKHPAFGVGWKMDAYHVQLRTEAWIGRYWVDMDVVTALSPDTEWSRRRDANPPFLLGRDGFLNKFNVCFDEPNKAMWLRKAIMEAQAGRAAWP